MALTTLNTDISLPRFSFFSLAYLHRTHLNIYHFSFPIFSKINAILPTKKLVSKIYFQNIKKITDIIHRKMRILHVWPKEGN